MYTGATEVQYMYVCMYTGATEVQYVQGSYRSTVCTRELQKYCIYKGATDSMYICTQVLQKYSMYKGATELQYVCTQVLQKYSKYTGTLRAVHSPVPPPQAPLSAALSRGAGSCPAGSHQTALE